MQIYTYLNFILKAASFAWVKFVWKKVPIKTHRHISNVLYCDTYCFTKLPYSPLVSFLMKANMLLMSKIKFQLSFLWESTSALDVHKFKELLSISIEIIEMIQADLGPLLLSRLYVISQIPSLEVLDDTEVQDKERAQARKTYRMQKSRVGSKRRKAFHHWWFLHPSDVT